MLTRRHLFATSTALAVAPSVRAFAAPASVPTAGPVLVSVFLRGGMDSLGIVAPVDDHDYLACRSSALRLLTDGEKPAMRIDGGPTRLDFRPHPESGALRELYQDNPV